MRFAWFGAGVVGMLLAGCCGKGGDTLLISWENDILAVRSDRLPGGEVEIWYLEAFCRRGSTDRDWAETTLPFKTELVQAEPDGTHLELRTVVDGKVEIMHEIRAGADEVDFKLTFVNRSDKSVDIEWAQPCMRVGDFTGLGQQDYFEKCFIFTDRGLTRMHETHRATEARYTPGQVYVPAGIDLNDVNPRPLSQTRPVNNLVGCLSADETQLLAMAWDDAQELFQGIIVCIHSDLRIGGLAPGATKRRYGKLYLLPNDPGALVARYEADFGGR